MNFTRRSLETILHRRPDRPPIQLAVESGTFEGTTTRLLAPRFARVMTIELDRPRYQRNLEVHADLPNVHFLFGDSADWVPELARTCADQPIFWYLDAHFTPGARRGRWKMPLAGRGAFPLWLELAAITERHQPDIVVVDDVHAFGRKDGDWNNVSPETINRLLGVGRGQAERIGDQYVVWR